MAGQESLVIIRRENEILFGLKKSREGKIVFGKGKWNGFGGKLEDIDNGSLEACAIRETFDECGIVIPANDLIKVGHTHYVFKGDEPDHFVTIFEYRAPNKDFEESEEMLPKWFEEKEIPYDSNDKSDGCGMWHNDRFWLPIALRGEGVKAKVLMTDGHETLSCVINGKEYIK